MIARALSFVVPFAFLVSTSAAQDEPPPSNPEAAAEDAESEPGAEDEAGANDAKEGDGEEEKSRMTAGTFAALRLRSIGPALGSGRIGDFAVDPRNRARYFAAVASGGVWRTENAGTTWTPVFDGEGSYSIGCITLDPSNPHVVWVGTGENNSQRSVSFGDGVYKSVDGGKSWKNVGLKASEHIGRIVVDPRDPDVVFVAAQGPLWNAGGDRGLYKTVDGGKSWRKVLEIDEHTGVNEVHIDPRDPDSLYASSYQRRRRVWTLIDGGPGSAIWKSDDAGETWRKVKRGLPDGDLGRIGMAVSPVDPDYVYAIVEAQGDKGGFYRSTNRGESWERRSSYMTSSPQYYNELVADPVLRDRVYALDTYLQVSDDGGRTFDRVPGRDRHVDDHALWIDPSDNDYLLAGCDGGVYESFDRGANWAYKANLPVSQFYRVSVDESRPFYYVYGGTQDNNSMGGPSRTLSRAGIANEDWFVTVGGDGYETVVDPTDPNLLYSLWQYGGLVRHDRRSGEILDIRPAEKPGEVPYRWNWDSPLMLSPHSHTRLYFAANRLFCSDDRGDNWRAISGDLSRGIDRNTLEVMGKVWPIDAVAKNRSTSFFGNCVSLTESPLVEGLIYVGTDDGLIQVTEDGGESWRRIETFPTVPDMTYVSRLEASLHHPDVVYAAFDAHKDGDFEPYVLRSDDRGATWRSITGDLPDRHVVYALEQDHVVPDLLFAGTEFGVFFTPDGGEHWIELTGGVPTIAVRDVAIQRREGDLVLGTFGRSFYVLDDYSPLRHVSEERFEQEDAILFPVKDALHYVENSRLGGRSGRGSQGAAFFTAENPEFGATFTYYLKEKILTRQEGRETREKDQAKAKQAVPYPTFDELRAEDEELPPQVFLTIRDERGAVVNRVEGSRGKGMHRVAWNLRYPETTPVRAGGGARGRGEEDEERGGGGDRGRLCLPGRYSVSLSKQVDGTFTELAGPVAFNVVPLGLGTLAAPDVFAAAEFERRVAELRRAVSAAVEVAGETDRRLALVRQAIVKTPSADPAMLVEAQRLQATLNRLRTSLSGDRTVSSREEPTSPSIRSRVEGVVANRRSTTAAPTGTEQESYRFAGEEFSTVLAELRHLVEKDLRLLEVRLEQAGAPYTPGRLPDWRME